MEKARILRARKVIFIFLVFPHFCPYKLFEFPILIAMFIISATTQELHVARAIHSSGEAFYIIIVYLNNQSEDFNLLYTDSSWWFI